MERDELEREERYLEGGSFEVRAKEGGEGSVLVGFPIVFGSRSVELGDFVEEVHPDAVDRSLEEDDWVALFNHRSDLILGRKSSGTARFEVVKQGSTRGVRMEVDLPDTSVGRDMPVLVGRRDVKGGSFGFGTRRDEFRTLEDGRKLRTLLEIKVFDLGPVTFPAYPATDVAMRSLEAWEQRQAEAEAWKVAADRRGREIDLLAL